MSHLKTEVRSDFEDQINVTFKIGANIIGDIELIWLDAEEDDHTRREYLLQYRRDDETDPFIITRGNL